MNSSLDALVKNLSGTNDKYLLQEYSGKVLDLVKAKGSYPYKYIDSSKKFYVIDCLIDMGFTVLSR